MVDPQGRRPGEALGIDSGISKSEVSRICTDLDVEVAAFRDRPHTDASCPYVFLDTRKARVKTIGSSPRRW